MATCILHNGADTHTRDKSEEKLREEIAVHLIRHHRWPVSFVSFRPPVRSFVSVLLDMDFGRVQKN